MNVCEVIGYAALLGELIVEIARSPGTVIPSAAADAAPRLGATNRPALFSTAANVKPFWSAYACSTYPIAPCVCLIAAATPELPEAPVPVGHLTVLSGLPAAAVHAGL